MFNFSIKIDLTITKVEKANRLTLNMYSEEDNIDIPLRFSPSIEDVYTPFLNDKQDIAIATENVQEYTKQIRDLNTNTRLITFFLFNEHYSLIHNPYSLVSSQICSDDAYNYICCRCLSSCKYPPKYYYHLRFCVKNKATEAITELPQPGTILSFRHKQARQKITICCVLRLWMLF